MFQDAVITRIETLRSGGKTVRERGNRVVNDWMRGGNTRTQGLDIGYMDKLTTLIDFEMISKHTHTV